MKTVQEIYAGVFKFELEDGTFIETIVKGIFNNYYEITVTTYYEQVFDLVRLCESIFRSKLRVVDLPGKLISWKLIWFSAKGIEELDKNIYLDQLKDFDGTVH